MNTESFMMVLSLSTDILFICPFPLYCPDLLMDVAKEMILLVDLMKIVEDSKK